MGRKNAPFVGMKLQGMSEVGVRVCRIRRGGDKNITSAYRNMTTDALLGCQNLDPPP